MPKSINTIFDQITSWDNLMRAYKAASKMKRYHRGILEFDHNLSANIYELRNELISERWMPHDYRCIESFYPKYRVIHAPAFCDRVLHHAIVQILGEFLESKFYHYSFACQKGKGPQHASDYLSHMIRSAKNTYGKFYALKADISKYFATINHEILLKILGRYIKDKRVLRLLKLLIECGPYQDSEIGLPLGCLTSQLFANLYLDKLDHYIKDHLGVKYYVRYMDDFIILAESKAELHELYNKIRDFLIIELHLTLNKKTGIINMSHGIDFAGYRHFTHHKLPRKRNVRNAKKRFILLSVLYRKWKVDLNTVRSSVHSFLGYMKFCKGSNSTRSVLRRLRLQRDWSLKNISKISWSKYGRKC